MLDIKLLLHIYLLIIYLYLFNVYVIQTFTCFI